jgi:hypothetical protein
MTVRVRIYKPAKSAAQSGRAQTHAWRVEPEIVTPRAPEPLMGWVSAADTMSEMQGRLSFHTVEEAVVFVRKQGWDYALEEPAARRLRPRNYLDNFRIIRPEDEERKSEGK